MRRTFKIIHLLSNDFSKTHPTFARKVHWRQRIDFFFRQTFKKSDLMIWPEAIKAEHNLNSEGFCMLTITRNILRIAAPRLCMQLKSPERKWAENWAEFNLLLLLLSLPRCNIRRLFSRSSCSVDSCCHYVRLSVLSEKNWLFRELAYPCSELACLADFYNNYSISSSLSLSFPPFFLSSPYHPCIQPNSFVGMDS